MSQQRHRRHRRGGTNREYGSNYGSISEHASTKTGPSQAGPARGNNAPAPQTRAPPRAPQPQAHGPPRPQAPQPDARAAQAEPGLNRPANPQQDQAIRYININQAFNDARNAFRFAPNVFNQAFGDADYIFHNAEEIINQAYNDADNAFRNVVHNPWVRIGGINPDFPGPNFPAEMVANGNPGNVQRVVIEQGGIGFNPRVVFMRPW